jgi:predicted amidohydrolase YtcJ
MRFSRRAFTASSLAALASACVGQQSSSVIVRGGRIYSGAPGQAPVEAIRFSSAGVIEFLGSYDEARSGARIAQEINLQGAAALPGFVDSHVHLTELGLKTMQLDVTGTPSVAALKQSLGEYAQSHPSGVIVGRGWIETHWPEHRFPNRDDLDAVVHDRPVYLTRADGHAAVCNSAMLELAGVTDTTPDPQGGRIERDAHHRATGMLIDGAKALAEAKLPPVPPAQLKEALRQAAQIYASRGWVGVANMSTSLVEADNYDALAAAGQMPLYADLYIQDEDADGFFARGPSVDRSGRIHRRGVKIYMDGALGSRGAALLAPYSDMPSTNGLFVTPPDHMREIMRRAKAANAQIATHAIGDRGNRQVLDMYRDAFGSDSSALKAARWRIEHAQILSPQDIPRFGQMGVIASMQPSHCIGDMYFAPARLGEARLGEGYAWKSLWDSGAILCGGTDAPVEKGDPLIEYYAAVYRHSLDGFAAPDWHLDQVLSRQQALTMFTQNAAFATMQEHTRGTLEVGKKASLSVFSVDLMTAPPEEIPPARPLLTISDGQITHNAL